METTRNAGRGKGEETGTSSGAAGSLFGRIDPREMGSRAFREPAPSIIGALPGKASTDKPTKSLSRPKPLSSLHKGVSNPVSLLEATSGLEGIKYRPRTKETRQAWEYLLAFVHRLMGSDQPHDVTVGAADEILQSLKNDQDNIKDLDRKKLCESILGYQLDADRFAQLVNLGKKITDYGNWKVQPSNSDATEAAPLAPSVDYEQNNLNGLVTDNTEDASGVAVVFEESSEEELDVLVQNKDNYDEDDEVLSESELPVKVMIKEPNNQSAEQYEYNMDNFSVNNEEGTDTFAVINQNDLLMIDEELKTELDSKIINLEALSFQQGGHTMTNKKCILPEGTFKKTKVGYEEIHVPAPKVKPLGAGEKLIPITTLPMWARLAFSGMESLNRIQSRVFPVAWGSDENLLMCAPTGAGKTNVAVLTMLREIEKHLLGSEVKLNEQNESVVNINLDAFKIVYVAPMKALVQEVVTSLSKRLSSYGIVVSELTGDQSLTKGQIAETQVLVTTPEKWDVVTRKGPDHSSYIRLVRLIIFDEIHLLHDDRGPVLEALVARTLRRSEESQQWTRLVGLSATLPNYGDVARFLRADPKSGVFFFDSSFRPCPLVQQFVGITERKALRRMQMMNEIVYEKVIERAGASQIIIFVHSRKDTAKTAQAIRDLAIQKETIGTIMGIGSVDQRAELNRLVELTTDSRLKELLPYGFAIHHAGLGRADRGMIEDGFSRGIINVLVSTATLAWGVNLPAHTVMIKGTQVYSPEKGRWTELSAQDVLQMLGRAGRPQFDVEGEGIIITTHGEMQFYLSLLNQQLPIESQLMGDKLADHLNAEVVLGTINSIQEGVRWLGYTYLYVRMLREPLIYGVEEEKSDDEGSGSIELKKFRFKIIHSALLQLEKSHLIKYDRRTGQIQSTELGRIAAHYYLGHGSMATYQENMRPTMEDIDLFRVFSLSHEFKLLPVRQEEKMELVKLAERVPIPIRENPDEPVAKVNILLQAYISQLALEGFALAADMTYVKQSASRLLRALFEMALRRGWAKVTRKALNLCLMVENRQWMAMSPLRQLLHYPISIAPPLEAIIRMERKEFPWERIFDLNPQELGELVRLPKQGRALHKVIQMIPRFEIQCQVVPISRTILRLDITILPKFEWNDQILGRKGTVGLYVIIEDCDGERIMYHEMVHVSRPRHSGTTTPSNPRPSEHEPIYLTFTLGVGDFEMDNSSSHANLLAQLPPCIFVNVMADRWIHGEWRLAVDLRDITMVRGESTSFTKVLDLAPLNIEEAFREAPPILHSYQNETKQELIHLELADDAASQIDAMTRNFQFNPIQTMVFPALYRSDENVLITTPPGCGKTLMAEFAIWRMLLQGGGMSKCVIISGYSGGRNISPHGNEGLESWIKHRWSRLFGEFFKLSAVDTSRLIVELTGDLSTDLKLIEQGAIIIYATPEQWDLITRRWRQRRAILQTIKLLVVDDFHWMGVGEAGTRLEVVLSRMRLIAASTAGGSNLATTRLVLLGDPIGNAKDICEWLGVGKNSMFNFDPAFCKSITSTQQIQIQSIDQQQMSSTQTIENNEANLPNATNTKQQVWKSHQVDGMIRPAIREILGAKGRKVIVVVDNRKAAKYVARELDVLLRHYQMREKAQTEEPSEMIKSIDDQQFGMLSKDQEIFKEDLELYQMIKQDGSGVAYIHEGQAWNLQNHLELLYVRSSFGKEGVSSKDTKINVLVASRRVLREHPLIKGSIVIIMGTQVYEGREHRYVDYGLAEVHSIIGRAGPINVPGLASCFGRNETNLSKVLLLVPSNKRGHYRNLLYTSGQAKQLIHSTCLPIESHLDQFLLDPINAEITAKTITTKQEAIDWITWTFFYRRLGRNPNYYGLSLKGIHGGGIEGQQNQVEQETLLVSAHLSGLIESCLNDLVQSKCVEIVDEGEDNEKLVPLNLGLIAAYYRIQPTTIEMFAISLTLQTKLRGILDLVAAASEFDTLTIREGESTLLARINERVPIKYDEAAMRMIGSDPHIKVNLLLQSYFGRLWMPSMELENDRKGIVRQTMSLVQALVDVASSQGWLTPGLAAMEFSQMLVQAMWNYESPLKQVLPYCSAVVDQQDIREQYLAQQQRNSNFLHILAAMNKDTDSSGIESVFDLIDCGVEQRESLFMTVSFTELEKTFILQACDRYPNIEMRIVSFQPAENGEKVDLEQEKYQASINASAGQTIQLEYEITQPIDQILQPVISPYFPNIKTEAWWLVIGDEQNKTILGIKKVTLNGSKDGDDVIAKTKGAIQFAAPELEGSYPIKTYLISDSWAGCDQEFDQFLKVCESTE